jgi:hypothetical protein
VPGSSSVIGLFEELDFGIIVVAFLVSFGLALLMTLAVWLYSANRRHFWLLLLPTFTLSSLGFITGDVMAGSRAAAVGTVLPAVLTLLGGILVYLVGAKGLRSQVTVSGMVLCFAFALFIGSNLGARLRFDPDAADPAALLERARAIEENRQKLEIQRLVNYVQLLKLKRDLTAQEELDLSRFNSELEIKLPPGK